MLVAPWPFPDRDGISVALGQSPLLLLLVAAAESCCYYPGLAVLRSCSRRRGPRGRHPRCCLGRCRSGPATRIRIPAVGGPEIRHGGERFCLETFNPLYIFQYSQHWVLRPASVRGVEVAKASAAAKARGWVLHLATTWPLYPKQKVFVFVPAGFTTTVIIYYIKVKF